MAAPLSATPQASELFGLSGSPVGIRERQPVNTNSTLRYSGEVKFSNGQVHFTRETADTSPSPEAAIYIGGWLGVEDAYGPPRHNTAELGLDAITFDPPRNPNRRHLFDVRHWYDPLLLQSMAIHGLMKAMINHHGYTAFHLLGHSWGAPVAVETANHDPSVIKSVLIVAGAGQHRQNPLSLAGQLAVNLPKHPLPRITEDSLRFLSPAFLVRLAQHEAAHVGSNILRTAEEGVIASTCFIPERMNRARGLGVKIGSIMFAADELFPAATVAPEARAAVDEFRVFPDPEATHFAPQLQPQEVANEVIRILGIINALSSKP